MGRKLLVVLLLGWSWPVWAATTTFLESGSDATQGFEFYLSTTGSPTSDSTVSHTGPRSIKIPTTGSVVTPTGVVTDTGAQISFWFRLNQFISSGNGLICQIRDASSATVYNVNVNPPGFVQNAPQGATAVLGTQRIAVNTWEHIVISYYVASTTDFKFKVYVNGVLDSTANAGTLTRIATSKFYVIVSNSAGGFLWVDDIYTATGGASKAGGQPDTGDIRVMAKRPNANGTTIGFTTQIGTAGSGYGTGHSPQVNEQPLSTTNGWSINDAGGTAITEEYNIENAGTGDGNVSQLTIVDVAGWVYTSSGVQETAKLIVDNVTTNILTQNLGIKSLFEAFSAKTTYPAGTGTDVGEISAAVVTTINLYEAGILIAYKPPTLLWTD